MKSNPYVLYPRRDGGGDIFRCTFSPCFRRRGGTQWVRIPVRFIALFNDTPTAKAVCADLNRSVR